MSAQPVCVYLDGGDNGSDQTGYSTPGYYRFVGVIIVAGPFETKEDAALSATTAMLGARIARRDVAILRLKRTIKRLESELAKERLAADFMR